MKKIIILTVLIAFSASLCVAAFGQKSKPLSIKSQGVFSAGGIVVTTPGTFDSENHWESTGAGQTTHADHANVFFQIPSKGRGLPYVFLHGYGQSRVGYQSTPDGREGWSDIFLRKGHGVFLIDGPRRGAAGMSSVAGDWGNQSFDQRWYTQFRMGRWENGKPVLNEGSQFPNDEHSFDQFFRQMTPDTGMKKELAGSDFDREMVAKAVAAAIDKAHEMTGKKSVLFAHSQGGRAAYFVPFYTKNVAAIVAIEPGGAPESGSREFEEIAAQKIPIVFYFGDYIDNGDVKIQATAAWQGMRKQCYDFANAFTERGIKSEVIDLPKVGFFGNDHFLFQNLNNAEIAEHVEKWISSNVK